MNAILAWHGDRALRDRIVQRMREHRAADAFIQGEYQILDRELPLGYRGCAIGCLLDPVTRPSPPARLKYGAWWAEVERQFGIRYEVAWAIDDIFESYPEHADASNFAVDAAEAIPVGADLGEVVAWTEDVRGGGELLGREHADELLELLRSAPVPARAEP